MATTNANINVNVKGINELNNLQTKIQGLNNGFASLRSALTGIAFASIIGGALRSADAIVDLSEATGLAVSKIEGFKKTIIGFGVSAEGAEKGILRLVNSIGEAADGSANLQNLFGKVGVTLTDLATLSEQEIFDKVINGLQYVTDASQRSLIVSALLGKEFRGLSGNTTELAQKYAAAADSAKANEASTKAAAQAYDNLQSAIGKFTTAITVAISPISELIAGLDSRKVQEFANEIVALVSVALGLLVISKIAAGFVALGAVITAVKAGTILASVAFAKFVLIGAAVATAIMGILSVLKLLGGPDLLTPLKNGVGKALDTVKELFGFETDTKLKDTLDKNTEAAEKNGDANAEAGKKIREVIDPFKSLREQISGLADDYARVNKANIDNINNSTALIGKSREESEVRKAVADLAKREADEIRKLTEQKAKLTKEQQQAGLGAEIDAQIEKIKQQTAADMEATETAIRNSERRANARKLEEFAINSQINVENQLQKIQDDIAKSTMSEIEKKQYDILAAANARAKAEIDAEQIRRGSLLTDQEKLKFYEAAKKGSDDLIRKEKELYDKSRQFSTGWAKAFKEYADNATNAARQAERIFSKVTQGLEDMIVNFVKTGKFEWKDFVSSMLEELLRSQIQQVFAGILGGMGGEMGGGGGGILGALGGLFGMGGGGGGARGGSPNSPVYVSDVAGGGGFGGGMGGAGGQQGGGLWDSISTMAGNVWSGVKNVFGGIADSVGSVFGGVADTVGSIFGGIANSAGNVFGSIGDTIGDAFGGITDAVGGVFGGGNDMGGGGISLGDSGGLWDSISSGIGGLFDGWFANGGNIGAGKFGVVGENGPELVSGPATVTPMGGGTNVTYNINAVDAMSFKQMLAQDPSFIYALSLQGSSGIAGRR
jgi:lambda family phage tail tape measure protein